MSDLCLRVEYFFPAECDGATVAALSGWKSGEQQFAVEVRVERVDRNHGARWTFLVREGVHLALPSRSAVVYSSFGITADQARHEAFAYARVLAGLE